MTCEGGICFKPMRKRCCPRGEKLCKNLDKPACVKKKFCCANIEERICFTEDVQKCRKIGQCCEGTERFCLNTNDTGCREPATCCPNNINKWCETEETPSCREASTFSTQCCDFSQGEKLCSVDYTCKTEADCLTACNSAPGTWNTTLNKCEYTCEPDVSDRAYNPTTIYTIDQCSYSKTLTTTIYNLIDKSECLSGSGCPHNQDLSTFEKKGTLTEYVCDDANAKFVYASTAGVAPNIFDANNLVNLHNKLFIDQIDHNNMDEQNSYNWFSDNLNMGPIISELNGRLTAGDNKKRLNYKRTQGTNTTTLEYIFDGNYIFGCLRSVIS